MTTNKQIERLKKRMIPLLKKHNVKRAGIFGSYARGEQNKNSDIDVLVEIKGSLFDLTRLELELSEKLKKQIDVISYNGINHHLKEKILSEEVRIL